MKTVTKKVIVALLIILSLFMALSVVYMARFTIKAAYNSVLPPAEITSVDLTEDEKAEDFEYFYNTVISSVPSIDNYAEAYGFSFRDRKEYYEKLIRGTKNDFEYYAVMDAIIQDVPSFHTDLLYPGSYDSVNCYNADKISSDRGVIAYSDYWCDILDDEKDKDNSDYYSFLYKDGDYYYSELESTACEEMSGSRLVTVDGVSADEYIISRPFAYNLYFDGKNDKPCRTRIVFNGSKGKECSVVLLTDAGEVLECTLFADIYLERVFLEKTRDIYSSNVSSEDPIAFENDNAAYVKIDNMSPRYAGKVEELLKNIKSENIILDLRENYGGNNQFAAEHIYPYLFSERITERSTFFIPISDANKCIASNVFDAMMVRLKTADTNPFDIDTEMYICTKTNSYVGAVKSNRNVVILSSHYTGSAADTFIHDMRKNDLAYVIGNNTGGEGLGYSFVESKLPNSNLAFIYNPGCAYTFDGFDNSVYGTRPDCYLETTDDFISYLDNNQPSELDELCANDDTIRYAYEYLMGALY